MAGGLAVVTHAISEEGTVAWLLLSTHRCRPVVLAVASVMPPVVGGCTCGGVRPAATSVAATIRCPGTRRRNWRETEHPIIRSFEPGEDWFWDYETNDYYEGPELAPPKCHPEDQTVPGPRDRVPRDWADLLGQQDD